LAVQSNPRSADGRNVEFFAEFAAEYVAAEYVVSGVSRTSLSGPHKVRLTPDTTYE